MKEKTLNELTSQQQNLEEMLLNLEQQIEEALSEVQQLMLYGTLKSLDKDEGQIQEHQEGYRFQIEEYTKSKINMLQQILSQLNNLS